MKAIENYATHHILYCYIMALFLQQNLVCLAGNAAKTPSPMEKLRQMETGMVRLDLEYFVYFR